MRIDVVAAIIRKDGLILITRRPENVHLGGLWEFPGGKVEPGESHESALEREILEEVGLKVRIDREFFRIDHDYPTKSVRLHFFDCTPIEGVAQPLQVTELQWVKPHDLTNFTFPPADAELIEKLRS